MHIVSELFVARAAAARRSLGGWDEAAALDGADDWFDEATGGDEETGDILPDESVETPSPLDEAREALLAHDQRADLDAAAMGRLWDLLDGRAPAKTPRPMEKVTRHGTRTLLRVPAALVAALGHVANEQVDDLVHRWTAPGGFATPPANAADVLRSLRDLARRTKGDGVCLYLLVLA